MSPIGTQERAACHRLLNAAGARGEGPIRKDDKRWRAVLQRAERVAYELTSTWPRTVATWLVAVTIDFYFDYIVRDHGVRRAAIGVTIFAVLTALVLLGQRRRNTALRRDRRS